MSQEKNSILHHLAELRDTFLRCLVTVLVLFLALVYFSNDIYTIVAQPLLNVLPEGASMIATNVAAPLLTPIKLTFFAAMFLAVPYLLMQVWKFVAPGLYKHERRLVFPLLFGSIILFYAGVAFAYFVLFPIAFSFFTAIAPEGVTIATDIGSYLSFVLGLFFAFGVAFQIPILTLILCWTGVTTAQRLREKRAYVIVAVFVIGMMLTPPDLISQTLLALPMWALFEIGLLASRFYVKKEQLDSTEVLSH
ncbi:twin-arginine translocase subunit TatC [Vibrio breoganii]|uniref:Sec-independent protein translocase protein TatC n=1 Tax=Vibrio breoganii TaxID=553239 RepID=A0ABX1UEW9_9VIBR|nr:twin-arginine translocase subunit TatC [Vibrio breoganii]NMO75139.1 twin-arginine translocase subunit TatC [Vibrio breoganii]NMR71647.1 twin-arginine translocase subunit TatC [Vibrio breoganii]PMG02869.1 twin arginine-targeting protein translocase TatC [Vibrio breoganii]PMG96742.1 twin arginine-targeting protein translocase TatC [Vibrio breoganii]PML90367.1 twin arginine-targeting protein translocase TatC [Vibrio breoganii]